MQIVRRVSFLLALLCSGVLAQMPVANDPQFVGAPIEDPALPQDPMSTDPAVQLMRDAGTGQATPPAPAKLEEIIGVGWDELRACTADADCVLLKDFMNCCRERPVNIRFSALIEENREKLQQTFITTTAFMACHTNKCVPPHLAAGCRNERCEAIKPPPRLEKVEAMNIAVRLLSDKLRSHDFGAPIFGFDDDKMMWMVDFGPMKAQHKARIKEKGVDTGYRVYVDDATGTAEIKTYEIKKDILP